MTRAVSGAGRPQAEQYKGHFPKGEWPLSFLMIVKRLDAF